MRRHLAPGLAERALDFREWRLDREQPTEALQPVEQVGEICHEGIASGASAPDIAGFSDQGHEEIGHDLSFPAQRIEAKRLFRLWLGLARDVCLERSHQGVDGPEQPRQRSEIVGCTIRDTRELAERGLDSAIAGVHLGEQELGASHACRVRGRCAHDFVKGLGGVPERSELLIDLIAEDAVGKVGPDVHQHRD